MKSTDSKDLAGSSIGESGTLSEMPQEKPSYRALLPAELKNIVRRLEQLEDELGSQVAVDAATGISQQLVSKLLKKGGDAGFWVVRTLAKYDHVPVEVELYGWIGPLERSIRRHNRWSAVTVAALRASAWSAPSRELAEAVPAQEWARIGNAIEAKVAAPIDGLFARMFSTSPRLPDKR